MDRRPPGELIAIGDLILPGLLGIMMSPIGLGSRFQPTSISWDGIGVFLMAHVPFWHHFQNLVGTCWNWFPNWAGDSNNINITYDISHHSHHFTLRHLTSLISRYHLSTPVALRNMPSTTPPASSASSPPLPSWWTSPGTSRRRWENPMGKSIKIQEMLLVFIHSTKGNVWEYI